MSEHETSLRHEPATSTEIDRRAYVRLASDLAATCRPTDRTRDVGWPGKVRDVSCGGIGLLLRHRFRPGTILNVELRDNIGKVLRAVSVRVVHATALLEAGNHCWLLGCAFDHPITDEELQSLV
jgi:hypothetical protein